MYLLRRTTNKLRGKRLVAPARMHSLPPYQNRLERVKTNELTESLEDRMRRLSCGDGN